MFACPVLRYSSNIFPSTRQAKKTTPHCSTKNNTAQPKKDKLFRSSSHLVFHRFSPFNCCCLVAKKRDSQNICRLCVCVLMNKRCFEHFMCLDYDLLQPTCDCRCFVHPISLAVNHKTRLIGQIRSAVRFMTLCSPMQLFVI